jgi:predicted transcriptional regulator
MKEESTRDVVYSINVSDIQDVADQVLDRRLTRREVALVRESVGDYVDWVQAIENAIQAHISDD